MSWNITTQLFDYMDTVVTEMVAQNLGTIIATITPLVGIGLAISLMVSGLYSMITGGGEPLSELLRRFVRYTIICGIAGAGGLYQTSLAQTAMKVPDEFAQTLSFAGKKDNSSMASMIDETAEKGLQLSKTALENGGISAGGLASFVLGTTIVSLTIVMCGIGTALILFAKFMMGLTVCFGPIFIYCLLFKPLTGLFDKWIGSIINYGLLIILLPIAFGLFMGFFAKAIAAAATPDAALLVPVAAAGLITFVGYFVMKKIPDMAASWGSGVSAAYDNLRMPGGASSTPPQNNNDSNDGNKGTGSPQQEGAAVGSGGGQAGKGNTSGGSGGMRGLARQA